MGILYERGGLGKSALRERLRTFPAITQVHRTMEVSGVTTRSEATTAARPLDHLVIPGGFETIVVDPPWPVKKVVRKVRPNQKAELDYVTMTLDEIKALPVQNIAADNAVLFLWTTHAFLESAFDVMRAWGFKYQRCLTWDKANGVCFFGFHHRTELCLFGYRGKIEMYPRRKAIPTVFSGKSERHSAKPDEFYKLVEPLGERRIDVFARRPRDGWVVWGNEV